MTAQPPQQLSASHGLPRPKTRSATAGLEWKPRSVQFLSFVGRGVLYSIPSALLISFAVGSPLLPVSLLVVLVAYAGMFTRSMLISLVADRRRARVVNFWRTFEFDWDDVVEIRDRSCFIGIASITTLGLVLRSGRTIPVEATAFPGKHGRAILKHLRALAEPHNVPLNIDPPRDNWMWGESFRPMPHEQRRAVPPRPRNSRR